jgi:hypothetical protein
MLGKETRATADGLFRVAPDHGPALYTHGPDLRAYSGSEPGFRPGDPERSPVCATDYYQHVIYAYPGVALPGNAAERIAEIRAIVRRMNAILNADSIASGGVSADYKVLCDGSGRIRVDTLALPALDFSSIIDAARLIGLVNPRADYTIFVDAVDTGFCGVGTYAGDESPGPGNANNSGGGFAAIERGCWHTTAPMHENGHNQGAVQYSAPSSTGLGAHCAVDYDVMCYSPDGGDLRQGGTTVRCGDRIHFDCGYNDYFDSAPEPGEYLASHWNLGSPANRFIRFSLPTGNDPAPATGTPATDSSRPLVVITQRPWRIVRTSRKARRVKLGFNAYEAGASYRCRLDRRRWSDCRSPWEPRLRLGRHVIRVRAIDSAGNASRIKSTRVRVARAR